MSMSGIHVLALLYIFVDVHCWNLVHSRAADVGYGAQLDFSNRVNVLIFDGKK